MNNLNTLYKEKVKMANKKETAAPNVSVGADTGQPIQKCSSNSITLKTTKFNLFIEKGGGYNG